MTCTLPYTMYYENSAGAILRLDRPPFVVTDSRLFDCTWKMTLAQRPMGEGGSLLARRRPAADRALTVQAMADSPKELSAALDTMADIFDYDVDRYTSGKLWVNGSYMRCWCSGRTKKFSCDFPRQAQITVTVTPEHPAWCTERRYRLTGGDSLQDSGGHRYPYRYPYRCGSSMPSLSINTTRSAPSPMVITLYGPAIAPRIYVAGMFIGITSSLSEGERVVIDQLSKTITKIGADGQTASIFGDRIKNGHTFEYAPAGISTVEIHSDSLGADITLIEQRSEPSWNSD